jgi:hypothetical protein
MLAKLQSASKLLKEQCNRHMLLQVYNYAWCMGLHWNRRGPESVSNCAVDVSDSASHQQVAEEEHATDTKGEISINQEMLRRRRCADPKQHQEERSLINRPL